ncbi:hypothetical protein PVIIG_05974 [Plasmodium vivax India VII]|uniref:Variable surface protein Vir24 n=1 Tax=Plasmodium vivax India VII TaxID=1077284 RepID=A0A0J9S1G1_PLAVI|nr:hypothetical protein PVIIG_05974 [Plasmodium vivax India VII]
MGEHSGAKYATLILKDSSPYILYNKFNRNNIGDKDIHYCVDMPHLRRNEKLNKLCKMFEKNLSELPTIMEEDSKEQCRYLTFWINDNIRNIFKTNEIPEDKHNYIIREFLSVADSVNGGLSNPYCKYYYNRDITMEIWKKWKDSYDYIRNKHNLQEAINTSKVSCEEYSTYYSYIEGIYNDYNEECCKKENGNCPEYLDFREWCGKVDVLTELTCKDSDKDDAHSVKYHVVSAGEERAGEEETVESEAKKGEQAQSQDLGVESLSLGRREGQFSTEPSVKERSLNAEGTEKLSNRQFGIEDNNGEPPKDNASNPVRTITYTSLGLVLPLVTLYRVKNNYLKNVIIMCEY